MIKKSYIKFVKALGAGKVTRNEPLRLHTSFRIGGKADLYFEAKTSKDMQKAVKQAHKLEIPFYVLGGGSNVLVSDAGYRGLIIRSSIKKIVLIGRTPPKSTSLTQVGVKRYEDYDKEFLMFSDLDYKDPPFDTKIIVGSGVSLAYLLNWSLENGLTGLEWFSGIPGSIGGAIYNNVHGGSRFFLSRVDKLRILTRKGRKKEVRTSGLKADYDYIVLQKTGDIILEVEIVLSSQGNLDAAKRVVRLWRERKMQVQPQTNCPGCIFKNVSQAERKKMGWPTTSVGYIFDRLLGWKGEVKVGKAEISEKHGNFIINKGGATAEEVISLMKKMKKEVKKRFGIKLEPEIQFVGFEKRPV